MGKGIASLCKALLVVVCCLVSRL